jgi:Protein of unknown function (DUF2877)
LPHISHPSEKNLNLHEADSIGFLAANKLSINQNAIVAGKTSRGAFIKLANNWLLFLSSEPFCGPLTLNMVATDGYLQKITSGMPVQISPKQMLLPHLDLRISFEKASIWRAPHPSSSPITAEECRKRLYFVCENIILNNPAAGLAPLIPGLINPVAQPAPGPKTFQTNILSFFEKLPSSNQFSFIDFINSILGTGRGLTPSGDDFVLGFLLALNRWGFTLLPGYNPQKLNCRVVEAAYKKTTTISANLIECAAQGQADERLIAVLDWLMSGTSSDLACIDEMLKWGHSSGIDVFVGVMFALSIRENCAFSE